MATLDEEQLDEEITGDDLEERVSPAIRAALEEETRPSSIETIHERRAREEKQRYERIRRSSRAFVERLPRRETLPPPGRERRQPGAAGRALAGGASDQVKNRLKQGAAGRLATDRLAKVAGLFGPYGKAAQLALTAFKYRKYLVWIAIGVFIVLGSIVVLIAIAIGAAFTNPAAAGTSPVEAVDPSDPALSTTLTGASGVPVFHQTDPRWRNIAYGFKGTIGTSGCGPTAAAMVLRFYGQNVTPASVAAVAAENGYRANCGTSHAFFPYIAERHGLQHETSLPWDRVLEHLKAGRPVIVSGRGSRPYSKTGHFIVLTQYNSDNTISVNDPAGRDGQYKEAIIRDQMSFATVMYPR